MPSPSFNAPIPGESLAHPPGSFPWDRPPQYTKPDEAITFIWKNLIKPSQLPKILHLLENGATVADIAKGTLVAGFQKGLWSIDLMMLIDQNVFRGDIYVKPARSINEIRLNFIATKTSTEFEEFIG